MSIAEVILAIRTWAVWHRNKVVCAILTFAMLANLITQCVFTIYSTINMSYYFQDPMYPGFRGCNFGELGLKFGGAYLPDSYISLTGVETIVLILMIISAIRLYRHGYTSELSQMIHRDGIFFYVILLAITIGNIVISFFHQRLNGTVNTAMLTPLEEVLYSVLTCRIVMNIRDAGSRSTSNGAQTELHTTYQMEFAHPGSKHTWREGAAWPQPAMELQATTYTGTTLV